MILFVCQASEGLNVQKRRIYDITNVLEGKGFAILITENSFIEVHRSVL